VKKLNTQPKGENSHNLVTLFSAEIHFECPAEIYLDFSPKFILFSAEFFFLFSISRQLFSSQ
jgi:hypothetical protein